MLVFDLKHKITKLSTSSTYLYLSVLFLPYSGNTLCTSLFKLTGLLFRINLIIGYITQGIWNYRNNLLFSVYKFNTYQSQVQSRFQYSFLIFKNETFQVIVYYFATLSYVANQCLCFQYLLM